MAALSRIVVLVAFALAFAGSAQAASEESPGSLKKQVTTPEQVALPQAQPPAAPITAPTTDTKSTGKTTPVNKGTAKKLVQTQTTATTTPTTSGTSTRSRTAKRSRTATRRAASRTSRRASQRARSGQPAASTHARTPAVTPAAVLPAQASETAKRRHAAIRARHASADKPSSSEKKDDPAPLTSLSRTADHVIEVIPGAVVLALAGLSGLVLLLILRSLAVERQRGKALATSYGVTVEALASAIEAKDHTTGGHIERVRRLGLLLASKMVPRDARDPQMAYGFLLHDIGKLAVPDAILRAPGRLTEDQWALMRRHPEEGARMLANVPFLGRALDVVRHHHERWDGGGYPQGLKGEDIPLWARIFSVVDALDAITAERPYRAARSYESALEEIRRHAGTQFDPAVVAALESLDPSEVEPLLEPMQQIDPEVAPLEELPQVGPLVVA